MLKIDHPGLLLLDGADASPLSLPLHNCGQDLVPYSSRRKDQVYSIGFDRLHEYCSNERSPANRLRCSFFAPDTSRQPQRSIVTCQVLTITDGMAGIVFAVGCQIYLTMISALHARWASIYHEEAKSTDSCSSNILQDQDPPLEALALQHATVHPTYSSAHCQGFSYAFPPLEVTNHVHN